MDLQISDNLQTFLIGLLRYAFSLNTKYAFSDDRNTSQIAIYRELPRTLPNYPIVIVKAPTITDLPRYFSDNLLYEVTGEINTDGLSVTDGLCYQVFGGSFESDITIQITAPTTKVRELIADYIIKYLRYQYKSYLETRRVDITQVERSGTSFEVYGSELLYMTDINMHLTGEWEDKVIPGLSDNLINEVKVTWYMKSSLDD